MPSTISTSSFARFVSAAALAAAAVLGAVNLRDREAAACGWDGPTDVSEVTTFDPAVAEDPAPQGLFYDPYMRGFGGPCEGCGQAAMLKDWDGYLKGAVPRADWEKVLFNASRRDLEALAGRLGGRGGGAVSIAVDPSTWKPAGKARVTAALAYVGVARAAEQIAGYDASGASPADISRLLDEARRGLKATKDPFLAQRYAFQIIRIQFYQRDYAGLVEFFDKNSAKLEKPSGDLAWRARYYVAGALRRGGNRPRANLELARIHAGWPDLAAVTAQDFEPLEEADWREALRLAKDKRERALLWRLVGITQDGVVAAQEIVKLDPTSKHLALLVLRELAKAEATSTAMWGGTPDATQVAAQQKALAAIEKLASTVAATKGADRAWLMRLVAGHAAALRGDVAAARTNLDAAVKARPGDKRVQSQARASLALALVSEGTIDAKREDEIARAMLALDPGFSRSYPVTAGVRARLAATYLAAGRPIEAEFLRPGVLSEAPSGTGAPPPSRWEDTAFLREMIARAGKKTTAFDSFLLSGTHTRGDLERELAMRQLMTGDLVGANKTYASSGASTAALGTDPFVMHVVDCHDCDHAQYADAPWTHASFVARMAELSKKASGKGDAAAQAALELGIGYYNVTWYGNARVVLDSTHQATRDTKPAERWFKKAYELATSRELKARAAFYAAKAEMGTLITAANPDPWGDLETLPVPSTWYPVLAKLADTTYYKEVLAECGTFRSWVKAPPRRK